MPFRDVLTAPVGAPVLACWLVGPQMDAAIRAALPGCRILASTARDLAPAEAAIRAAGGNGPLVLAGWSAGCESVRALLLAGVEPAAVVTLDGTHASLPAADWQIDVWRALAEEARRGERLWIATCTQQLYVESLPAGQRFTATRHVLERAVGCELPPGAEIHEGGLHVYSVPSAAIDAEAHKAQLRDWLPRVLREHVAPWLGLEPIPATVPTGGSVSTGLRTLRRGMTGEDVKAWQETLGRLGFRLDRDGRFGPLTEDATKEAQAKLGATPDGVVGPRTRAAAAIGPAPVVVSTAPRIPFVQARNYTPVVSRQIDLVVLHSMESPEKPDTAEAVAAWFAGPNAPMASAHFCVDSDSIVQCVQEHDVAWGAPGANRQGAHVELAGRASQGPADWADAYSTAMLERAASLVADICRRHSIPVVFVDTAGLLRGERGITAHAEVTQAWHRTTHTDPGASFPMAAFVARVAALL